MSRDDPRQSAAVARFVGELRLSHGDLVLAALALRVAESFEGAPLYARSRLATELREIVAALDAAEAGELASRRGLLRGVDAGG